ncbi:RNA polymerase II elongation factor ELL-like isoform X2 [Betta splendens]|uniref:RNA polymerase II elongation factor ELL-like isoform X2 n=1 Tax=Betta splendens TaxID=158456 RepID=A0A6P7LIK6_BETSP|nr:RNA polymerase II elongation factor ELL-like isoform X2 [Betta splendens]
MRCSPERRAAAEEQRQQAARAHSPALVGGGALSPLPLADVCAPLSGSVAATRRCRVRVGGGMSTLAGERCYGLSSGNLSRGGNVSVLHVKLTDSAARAIGAFQSSKGWSSRPTICFNGNHGRIAVPCSEKGDEVRIFTFGVTNVARDNPHGSFDCVQQLRSGPSEELSCLGVIQKKMTVNATDDSYDKARQSMAQAEEETRSRGAIVIKHGGRYQGKKVTVRPPAPALATLAKPKPSSQSLISNIKRRTNMLKVKKDACAPNRRSTGGVQDRPLRERVIHLLALRPYKRPDLILRLQNDGLSEKDRDLLDSVSTEVGQLNNRDNAFVLKDSLYKELQKDWPGYTSGDQQLLKRILVRRLFKPQQALLTVPKAQVSPLRDTPNSSPAHRPKHSLPEEYSDPPSSKKARISHLSNKASCDISRLRPSERPAHKNVTEATADGSQKNSLDPRKLFDSLSAVCHQEEEVAKRLQVPLAAQEKPGSTECLPEHQAQPDCDRKPSSLTVPDLSSRTAKRKKGKHKHRGQEKDTWREKKEASDTKEILFDSNVSQADNDSADYLLNYTPICSPEQRQHYKQEFNNEYKEYRELHARFNSVTQQFMALDTQLKQLHHESHKYKTIRNKILQEYSTIKNSNPNYNQDKIRCEYLHNKLAHIKKLISEYDQHQVNVHHSCPK